MLLAGMENLAYPVSLVLEEMMDSQAEMEIQE